MLGVETQNLKCSIDMKPKKKDQKQNTAQYCSSVVIVIREGLGIAAWNGKQTHYCSENGFKFRLN